MLNKEAFVLLAGLPDKWDEETLERCEAGEALPDVQVHQYLRGRRSAELASVAGGGWLVIRGTNIAPDKVLLGRCGKAEAIAFGHEWALEDPTNREFYARKSYITADDLLRAAVTPCP